MTGRHVESNCRSHTGSADRIPQRTRAAVIAVSHNSRAAIDGNARGGRAAAQSGIAVTQRCLHVELESCAGTGKIRTRGEFQTCISFGKGNEAVRENRSSTVVLKQRTV